MRPKRSFILLIILLIVSFSSAGCVLLPKPGILTLRISPSTVYISESVLMTFTLRERNGVGVSLNYIKMETYNQWGDLKNRVVMKGQEAEQEFFNLFGTHTIRGEETLQATFNTIESTPIGKRVITMGGTGDNGNSTRTSHEYHVKQR
ncbi:MAG: hypothetical protein GH144_03965 [Clostridia bacterium]|nr:hypothetical protein [Clostridia bacterium]